MGVIRPARPIDIVPDLVFGSSGGPRTLEAGINALFARSFEMDQSPSPYVEAGAALSGRMCMTLNLTHGAEIDVGSGPST